MFRLIQISDVDDTYCCHLSPRELREATTAYITRERGLGRITDAYTCDEVERREAQRLEGPSIYPSLTTEDSDEDRVTLDTVDPWTLEAYRRYHSILKRVERLKSQGGAKLAEKLATQREEWKVVERETLRSWDEASSYAELRGRDGQRRLNREAAEVAYTHRDPSDWQVVADVPDHIQERLDDYELACRELDIDFTDEDREERKYAMLAEYRRSQVAEMWKRHFSELGDDAVQGRIVTRWVKNGRRYIRPATTISMQEFVDRKIHEAGDELDGLNTAVASLRYRLVKKAERRRAA